MATNAVVARRRLALSLRERRLRAGLTLEEMARRMECSPAKISRMETGRTGVRVADLRMIADVLGLGPADHEAMIELVRQARGREWWHEFADIVPEGSATLFGLEDGAPAISQHSTSIVPGLLQTPEYARALISSVEGITADLVERRLALRLRRQHLLDRPQPPRLDIVLDEAVLCRVIGGAEVMAGQCRHLLARAAAPHVVVRVVPFDAATHAAEGVGFIIFEFDGEEDVMTPVVFAEQLSRSTLIDDPDEAGGYQTALAGARSAALTPERSLELIAARAAGLR
ncbi:XRE family transcriptional regulator [Frankia sp. R43]|uniref:helix-turn-helix domain-containing protein n=1 Tax=Frankia sp. R43 TaxID=269536 RepID=UPI0006CA2D9F|nr:helix-turn-helix transcriptional regulator [Frankia sp. R43]KPM50971.1 XRE family transcriptional regulator [Frankia sp. R43]